MAEIPPDLPSWLRWGVYIIQQVGFPAAVAWFVLYRLNGQLAGLKEAMHEVAVAFRGVEAAQKQTVLELRDEIRRGQ